MKKTALITGAGRGIGQAVAEALSRHDFNIVIADILPDAEQTISNCRNNGAETLYIKADINDRNNRKDLLEAARDKFNRLDLLVNNAGVSVEERKDMLEATEESFERVMNVNLKGPFFLTQAIATWMIRQTRDDPERSPKIVNIASLASYASATTMAEYCFSKTGVSMMTKLFADRLAGHGIHVYEIRPGIIKTSMTSVVRDKYDQFIEDGGLPIRRWGYPEDVAKAVVALAEGYLPYSTGEVLNVDGGFHLRRL